MQSLPARRAGRPRAHPPRRRRARRVTESQAERLTLTLSTAVAPPRCRPGSAPPATIDKTGKILAGVAVRARRGARQGRAARPRVSAELEIVDVPGVRDARRRHAGDGVAVEASLVGAGRQNATRYVMEIVVERGPFLSVPNEAIIEEGDRHIVYVQQQAGQYVPQEIHTGIQGELYTQVARRRRRTATRSSPSAASSSTPSTS